MRTDFPGWMGRDERLRFNVAERHIHTLHVSRRLLGEQQHEKRNRWNAIDWRNEITAGLISES